MAHYRHCFFILLAAVCLLGPAAATGMSVFAVMPEAPSESVLEVDCQKLKSLECPDNNPGGPPTVAASTHCLPRWIFVLRLGPSLASVIPNTGRWLLPQESGEFLL